ncbi:MAG: choice-of-anchor A family protein, partial [Saprospirales bacterium]
MFFALAIAFVSSPLLAQFEAQMAQFCEGPTEGDATGILVVAENAPSGEWEVFRVGVGVIGGPFENGEYVQFSGVPLGSFLQVRDAANESELAVFINLPTPDNTFISQFPVTNACQERECNVRDYFDLVEQEFAGGFSASNEGGILFADLSLPHNASFNALIFGNFTNTSGGGSVHGRMAVEGNFTSGSGFTIGEGNPSVIGSLNSRMASDNLIVGGNLDFSGGMRGNVLFNTATSLPGFISVGSASGIYRNISPDVDWTAARNYFEVISTSLAPSNIVNSCVGANTGLVNVIDANNIELDAENQSGIVVFELSSVGAAQSFDFINTSNADAIIVNVGGSTVVFTAGSIALDGTTISPPYTGSKQDFIEKTLWNFYEATEFNLDGYGIMGSVLAPFTTDVEFIGGDIVGQGIFSGNVTKSGGFDFLNFCFNGDLDICELEEADLPEVDLAVSKTIDISEPFEGDTIVFTVTAQNLSNEEDGESVQVLDQLPSGYTFISATPSVGTYDEISGIWDIGLLEAEGEATLEIE